VKWQPLVPGRTYLETAWAAHQSHDLHRYSATNHYWRLHDESPDAKDAMTDATKPELYPQYCFHLSPTINRWCHFQIADILALKSHPGFQGVSSESQPTDTQPTDTRHQI
jgi:hypothetical protein